MAATAAAIAASQVDEEEVLLAAIANLPGAFKITTNYTDHEKTTLATTWTEISTLLDGTGTGQQLTEFWAKVYPLWKVLNPKSHNEAGECGRSLAALFGKWRSMPRLRRSVRPSPRCGQVLGLR